MSQTLTESYNVACPHCAATNRLPREKPAAKAKCGKCGRPLFDGHPAALDAASFDKVVGRSEIPVVVDFWAEWCGPCKMMAPAFEQAAAALEPRVRLAKLDTEAAPEIAARLNIRSIPTVIVFRDGREVARQAGAMPFAHLKGWIEQHA